MYCSLGSTLLVLNYKVWFFYSNNLVRSLEFISEFTRFFLNFCQYPVSLLPIYTISCFLLLSHFFHIQIKFGPNPIVHFVHPLLQFLHITRGFLLFLDSINCIFRRQSCLVPMGNKERCFSYLVIERSVICEG
ncbi:unnamed protein product [Meloidogyne enterolobii]|uniref:Uncharacterized protein n=2 Tax=Meloidogyne enterolobii TaxID=390850 RepID=A0A6V7Y9F1_MELEN|nr:unnamed protein product [Meloidogyne enterolobii]